MRGGWVVSIGVVVLLAGCGATMSYKRGAGPDAMQADEQACRGTAAALESYVACMRARGWTVRGGENPAESAAAASWLTRLRASDGGDAAPASSSPATSSPAAEPLALTADPAAPAALASDADAASAPPFDPLAEVVIASWWKLGGSAAGLDAAIAGCVDELGAPHRPAGTARRVTAGLRACLRTSGWYGLAP